MKVTSSFIKFNNSIVKIGNSGSLVAKTSLPANTLLIEIAEGAEAQAWVESNYNSGDFSCEMKDTTHYYITNSSTHWSAMFWNFLHPGSNTYLLKVLDAGDTSSVTDMYRMFDSCSSLTTLDLSSFNTSSVTDMSYMFYSCSSLTTLDLSNFNTSSVTTMEHMFQNCSSLTTLDLSSFNTSSVTDMSYMFYSCSSLTTLDLSNFNTSSVTTMEHMFQNCSSLTTLDLSSFNTSSVTAMHNMFNSCSSLTTINLSSFDTSSITDMHYMFDSCISLTTLDLSNFNTSGVTNMSFMFFNCRSLTTLDLSNFNTSGVTDMSFMFNYCSSLTRVPLLDTSSVTNMASMFYGCTNVESGAYALYQQASSTGKVTRYEGCFTNCGSNTTTGQAELALIPTSWGGTLTLAANTLLIEIADSDEARTWIEADYSSDTFSYIKIDDTHYKITNSSNEWRYMFSSERHFSWSYLLKVLNAGDTSSITDMYFMFYGCSSLTEVPLFDTSSVTNMGCMFWGCTALTTVPLFDTSSVTVMDRMFEDCTNVESGAHALYQQASSTGKVTSYGSCFTNCGSNTTTGQAELALIPTSWGGTLTLAANTLLIEIADSDEARTWVEDNYNNIDTFSRVKIDNTHYKITNSSNVWTSMFDNDSHAGSNTYLLKVLDCGDTSSVTNMRYMFYGCEALTTLDLSNFDTSSVTNMTSMFYYCSSLTTINLSSFDTSSVTYMASMFYGCEALTTLDLSNFDTSSVTNMSFMFRDCSLLTTVPLLDTSGVTDMCYMFYGCTNVESGAYALYQQASSTGKVTSYGSCFTNCGSDTTTGQAELALIPTSWGGTKST